MLITLYPLVVRDKVDFTYPKDIFVYATSSIPTYIPEITEKALTGASVASQAGCPLSCQCVQLAKNYGFKVSGNANQIPHNTIFPCADCLVLTDESYWGHVAYIESIRDNQLFLIEQNHEGCCVVSTRSISIFDLIIRGYITR